MQWPIQKKAKFSSIALVQILRNDWNSKWLSIFTVERFFPKIWIHKYLFDFPERELFFFVFEFPSTNFILKKPQPYYLDNIFFIKFTTTSIKYIEITWTIKQFSMFSFKSIPPRILFSMSSCFSLFSNILEIVFRFMKHDDVVKTWRGLILQPKQSGF